MIQIIEKFSLTMKSTEPSGKPFLTESSDFIGIVSNSVEQIVGTKPSLSTAGGTSDVDLWLQLVPRLLNWAHLMKPYIRLMSAFD